MAFSAANNSSVLSPTSPMIVPAHDHVPHLITINVTQAPLKLTDHTNYFAYRM